MDGLEEWNKDAPANCTRTPPTTTQDVLRRYKDGPANGPRPAVYLGGTLVASRLMCASSGSFTRGEMAAHRVLADVDELHGKVGEGGVAHLYGWGEVHRVLADVDERHGKVRDERGGGGMGTGSRGRRLGCTARGCAW